MLDLCSEEDVKRIWRDLMWFSKSEKLIRVLRFDYKNCLIMVRYVSIFGRFCKAISAAIALHTMSL